MAITEKEKARLLSIVPAGAPANLKLNWNTKTKRWYYYLSKIEYRPEKRRGIDRRLTVGYEKDGKFYYTERYLLLRSAALSEAPLEDIQKTRGRLEKKVNKMIADEQLAAPTVYPIDIVFTVAFLAYLTGATTCQAIADFWKSNRDFLRKLFEDFPKKDISSNAIRTIFMLYQTSELAWLFKFYTKQFMSLYESRIANSDSEKTEPLPEEKKELFILSVYDEAKAMALGQKLIMKKSNEILAAQKILKTMDLNGCIVRANATHTHGKTAKLVIDAGGNYCFALEKNQEDLYDYAVTYFERPGKDVKVAQSTVDKFGTLEEREVWVLNANLLPTSFLIHWEGLASGSLVRMQAKRTIKATGEVLLENRYYICSLAFEDPDIAQKVLHYHYVRPYWGDDDGLHHVLDVSFLEERIHCKRPTYLKNRTMLMRHVHNVHTKYLQWLENHDEPRVYRSKLSRLLNTAEKAARCWHEVLAESEKTSLDALS